MFGPEWIDDMGRYDALNNIVYVYSGQTYWVVGQQVYGQDVSDLFFEMAFSAHMNMPGGTAVTGDGRLIQ